MTTYSASQGWQRDITSWSSIGVWHHGRSYGTAPAAPERTIVEYRLYVADYYGKGENRYLETKEYLQTDHHMQLVNLTSDGSEQRIANILKVCGVA